MALSIWGVKCREDITKVPFLISEWIEFGKLTRRFKSFDSFREEADERWTPINLDFPYLLYKPKLDQTKSSKIVPMIARRMYKKVLNGFLKNQRNAFFVLFSVKFYNFKPF